MIQRPAQLDQRLCRKRTQMCTKNTHRPVETSANTWCVAKSLRTLQNWTYTCKLDKILFVVCWLTCKLDKILFVVCWLTFLYWLCARTNWQNKRKTGRALLPLDGLYKAPSSCPGAPRVGDHSIVWSPSDPSQIRPCYKINSGGIITWNISLISTNVLIFLVFLDKFQTTMKKVFFFF